MPILEFEFIGDLPEEKLAQPLADICGEVLGSKPGQTWVKVRSLSANCYAENSTHVDFSPLFVSVILRKLPELDEREKLAKELCEHIAEVTLRPVVNIHLEFREGHGRIAFGGKLIR